MLVHDWLFHAVDHEVVHTSNVCLTSRVHQCTKIKRFVGKMLVRDKKFNHQNANPIQHTLSQLCKTYTISMFSVKKALPQPGSKCLLGNVIFDLKKI